MELTHLRQAIGVVDRDFAQAIARRLEHPLNAQLYTAASAPRTPSALAEALVNVPDARTKSLAIAGFYRNVVIQNLCDEGCDAAARECIEFDNLCLEALARRFNYSSLVGQTKLKAGLVPAEAIEASITNTAVEEAVYSRLDTFAREVGIGEPKRRHLIGIYRDWIVPASRILQVLQLQQRQRLR